MCGFCYQCAKIECRRQNIILRGSSNFTFRLSRYIAQYFTPGQFSPPNALYGFISLLRYVQSALFDIQPMFWYSSAWLWYQDLHVATRRWIFLRTWRKKEGVLCKAYKNKTVISMTNIADSSVTFLTPRKVFILSGKRTAIARNTKESTQPTLHTLNGRDIEILFVVMKSDKELIFIFRVIIGIYRTVRRSN